MQKLAFIFPGQGSQRVGMGKSLVDNYAIALKTFQEADEILAMNLSQLCFEGPEEKLRQTEYTQLAVLTCSVAALRVLGEEGISPYVVAGHSLGEYSALIACGALNFADALKLVQLRAQFMAEASQRQPCGMVAILGLDAEDVTAICTEASSAGIVQVANYNCPGQIIISGEDTALELAINLAHDFMFFRECCHATKQVNFMFFREYCHATKQVNGSLSRKAARAKRLPVSGAFHSILMEPAKSKLREAIIDVSIHKPNIRFIANVTGDYVDDPEQIRELLVAQITSPIQWEASIRRMISDGVTQFIEVGPGKVLSGMLRRIDKHAQFFDLE